VSSGVEASYLAGPAAAGRWTGSAARPLGLTGRVGEPPLRAVLSQQDPRSGEKLAGPAARARVPGFDLMFSVPKSASVLFGIGDERVQRAVLGAQEQAAAAGLSYLARHASRMSALPTRHVVRMGCGGRGDDDRAPGKVELDDHAPVTDPQPRLRTPGQLAQPGALRVSGEPLKRREHALADRRVQSL
jgi:hypothetical protein